MNRRFASFVIAAMILGIAVGWMCNLGLAPGDAARTAAGFSMVTELFLRLIKMIIAPLVFTTLVAGVGHMEDAAAVGRIGAKTMGWFLGASILSLLLGLAMVELLRPGAGLTLHAANPIGAPPLPSTDSFSLHTFITHLVPTSIFDAMARNEILQIVIFAIFVGTAVSMLDQKAPQVMQLVEQAASIMLKVTDIVMKFAPFAIFASLASTVTLQGLPILLTYAKFVGGFYLSLALLWVILFGLALLVLGRAAIRLFAAIREPALISFSCASSEAAYPKLLAALPTVGVPPRIASFVLPLGYSFNLDGSMMYCTFATTFILQTNGVSLTVGQQVGMLFLLLITSKGIAAVPRASLIVIMATLTYLGLPEGWIALVLAVDHLLDMGRSGTNIIGNSVAAAVVSKWEGAFASHVAVSAQPFNEKAKASLSV
ncbi:Na+/H+-dicarboxylate symporter [Sphingomonas sp. SORGH_AS 950]|uniref:dicarboxylate/amino acid:cation symporter n=1 Tax=Sphingomonas sp. SORGH_AS_0950 TaxID=3041792 RepID=UPI0027847BB6|nr:dicarboxylate/amino acid:cation symporter [Sphingomonas sp. SORGH_AS_0950]MDQ1159005.1 Na+/H+-dicarboxylate symporter [Sphingomonas sp. SORGH_AS_0950]